MNKVEISQLISDLNRLKVGDMEAFDSFYELTKRPIYYSIIALTKDEATAEDMLAETYVKFLNNLNVVKANKNPLGYLLVVARNLTLDYFKKENRINSIDDYTNEQAIGASVEEAFDDSERLLDRMEKLLSEDEYQIVVLYILSEFSHKEISKALKKPIGTVTWTYSNAIKKLQKGLSDYE